MSYIGRFAPSPSGPLHFGSLITALGSYLQAKAQNGKWLVRIEDIDPPRECPDAPALILKTLEAFGLYWDEDVLYQSACSARYLETLHFLLSKQLAYYCDCSRQRISTLLQGQYDNFCRTRHLQPTNKPLAIRLKQTYPVYQFSDQIQGQQQIDRRNAEEDFIIHRKDNLFAYNLVVVLDDHAQGVTEIVRGADLLSITGKQISLYHLLNWQVPNYCHLPLALDQHGNKLSKQNHATPLSLSNVKSLTIKALTFLGQKIPTDWLDASQDQLINWAVMHWNIASIPKTNRQYKIDSV
ncbi:tRNA glutamyl-Q(34) synthetase GluQRS [Orbaceae bacterium ESL0727]|nr:tRNA glutamyl-Q(34) synthetase GluQRS [Orbaceae bacterium ESL0727]